VGALHKSTISLKNRDAVKHPPTIFDKIMFMVGAYIFLIKLLIDLRKK